MGHGVAKEMGSRVKTSFIYQFLTDCYWESVRTGWAQYSKWKEYPANTALGTAANEIGLLRHGKPKSKGAKRSMSSFWASDAHPTREDARAVKAQYKVICDRYNEGRADPEPLPPMENFWIKPPAAEPKKTYEQLALENEELTEKLNKISEELSIAFGAVYNMQVRVNS